MSAVAWDTVMAAIQAWVKAGSGLDDTRVLWSLRGAPRPSADQPWIELNIEEQRSPAHDWTTKQRNVMTFPDQLVTLVDTVASAMTVANHPFVTADGPVQITAGTPPPPLQLATDYWLVVLDPNRVQIAATYENTGGNNVARGMGNVPNPVTVIPLTGVGVGPIHIVETPDTVRAGQEILRTAQGLREVHLQLQAFGPLNSGNASFALMSDVIASLPLHLDDLDGAGVGVSDLGTSFVQGSVRSTPGHRGDLLEPRTTVDMVVYVASSLTDFITYIETVKIAVRPQTPDGTNLPEIDVTIRS